MLILPTDREESRPNARRERRLWHDEKQNTPSIGCQGCPQKGVCGGLRLDHALYDCLGFCCGKPDECDRVCRNRPDAFARSVREINGFLLDNVPRAPILAKPPLPELVPIIYHRAKRVTPFAAPFICLPLYDVIARHDGNERFESADELTSRFAIAADSPIVLTGTDIDPPLERWWSLSERRKDAIRALRDLNVALVTTPNFSMFTDRPRWDDMHAMKRIAIVHEEFLSAGMPAALHVNARTERDWDRWKQYVADRPEVTHIAFEFGTGAGWGTRTAWHVDQLVQLSRAVGRPLHLVMRGGTRVIPALHAAYAGFTLLETTVFMKTEHRQKAVLLPTGKVKWHSSPTKENEPVDSLLTENWNVIAAYYADVFDRSAQPLQRVG